MLFLKVLKIIILLPFSSVYKLIVEIRNFLYDYNILKATEFDIPIISIGNITIGGTGKTPHAEYLINLLKENYKIAVLSRGYKRKTKGFRLVESDDNFRDTGDEALQIKNKFPQTIVAVSENRVTGIKKLLNLYNEIDVILLDDAFQHRRIKPGLSILLINYNKPIKQDHLLPLGRLREPASSSYRADIIIYTKCPETINPIERRIIIQDIKIRPYQSLYFSKILYTELSPVFVNNIFIPTFNELSNYHVLLITGIASSDHLVKFIRNFTSQITHLKFSDHYNFRKKDYQNILKTFNKIDQKKIIITTEKDSIRLKNEIFFPDELKKFLFCIPIKIEILSEEDYNNSFENKIYDYVRQNKANNRFYI